MTQSGKFKELSHRSQVEAKGVENQVKFISRPEEERRKDVLSLIEVVTASADAHPDDQDNPLVQYRQSGPETQVHWIYANRSPNVCRTSDLKTYSKRDLTDADELKIETITKELAVDDLRQAAIDAVGIEAINTALKTGDFATALTALRARPDLIFLPEIVNPVVEQLHQHVISPGFLLEGLQDLTNHPVYGERLLEQFVPTTYVDLSTPINDEQYHLGQFERIGENLKKLNEAVTEKNERGAGNQFVNNTVWKALGDTLEMRSRYDRTGNQFTTIELYQAWSTIEQTSNYNLPPIEQLTRFAESEQVSQIDHPRATQEIMSWVLIAAVKETQDLLGKSGTSSTEQRVHQIGYSLALVRSQSDETLTQAVNQLVEDFAKKRPVLASNLRQGLDEFDSKLAANDRMIEATRKALSDSATADKKLVEAMRDAEETNAIAIRQQITKLANLTPAQLAQVADTPTSTDDYVDSQRRLAQDIRQQYTLYLEDAKLNLTLGKRGFAGIGKENKKVTDEWTTEHSRELEEISQSPKYQQGDPDTLIKHQALKRALDSAKNYQEES